MSDYVFDFTLIDEAIANAKKKDQIPDTKKSYLDELKKLIDLLDDLDVLDCVDAILIKKRGGGNE